MGFEVTRFEGGQVDEELTCLICNGVFQDPVWFPSCQHTFCTACIHKWLQHQTVCPVDRHVVETGHLEKAPRILSVLLSRLTIRCDNATHGCDVIVSLDHVTQHLSTCQYNPKRPIDCIEGCGLVVPFDELKEHHCVRDLRWKVAVQAESLASLAGQVRSHRATIDELQSDLYQLKVKLKLFDSHNLFSRLLLASPDSAQIQPESSEERFSRWVKCLPVCRVNRWGGLISTPDSLLRNLLHRSLAEAGCPDDFVSRLAERCHERCWPPGLRSLEARQSNQRAFEQLVCKRLPGRQVALVVPGENPHMDEHFLCGPGLVLLFAHGVETAL